MSTKRLPATRKPTKAEEKKSREFWANWNKEAQERTDAYDDIVAKMFEAFRPEIGHFHAKDLPVETELWIRAANGKLVRVVIER